MDENSTFIDYQKETNDTKEILNNLLKKMLDHKLNKLEKKSAEESNSLKIISKISQHIIISLEHYSHKVRKEIYKIRHKNDENQRKKREHDMNKKSNENKDDKNNTSNIDNNIEALINKVNKSTLDNQILNKQKRASKSIDPKKDKSFFSEISTNAKEKSGKKEKMDVFSRLASKSIGNFKKLKLGINGPPSINNHLLSSKSKNKKSNASTKNLHNILNKKNEGEKNSEQSPSNKVNPSTFDRRNSKKLIGTPKLKHKPLKKIAQINIENTINNINETEPTKNSSNFNKLKKMNSKGKLSHRPSKTIGLKKKEENKNIENNNNKILDNKNDSLSLEHKEENIDNKIKELKITSTILSKINNNNENKTNELFPKQKDIKRSIKEKLLLDEEIIKNVDKDSLLISTIKDDKINEENEINEINEISAINMDDINLKESINLNLENKDFTKKQSIEINNNSVNSFNNNNPVNNIKTIITEKGNNNNINNNSHINANDNNISKQNNKINDIIITNQKNNPVNYLDNDNEINFTLVEDSHLDENDNDLNKTIDLNISGMSEQLSLEEKFESHLDEISRYLEMKDLCNLMLVNKECFTTIMNILISKTEITIEILEDEINKLKETNKDIDFNKVNISPFKFSSNSSRAVSLLNNSSGCNLIKFSKGNSLNKEIFLIFGIFFIAAGKKNEYLRLNDEEEKIKYITNFFKKDIEKMSLGSLIEKEINEKLFDDNIISSLYTYSYKHINIISPNRFQKTNKDIAIFVFVVKNILEHIGALDHQNLKPDKEYILYNARLKNNKIILEELNNFLDKIS